MCDKIKPNKLKYKKVGGAVSFSYNKLWKLLIDKNMRKVDLRDAIGITPATLAKLSKNQNVNMEVLARICQELKCDIGDIIEYVEEDKDEI